jgi:hypothetical protein
MTMRHTHDEPYVVERDRTVMTTDTNSPALLIIGILLAIGLAIGAWFAFVDNGGSTAPGDTTNPPEQVVPGDTTP